MNISHGLPEGEGLIQRSVPVTVMEEPTCMMRWVPDHDAHVMNVGPARKLQQAWNITTLHDGKPIAVNTDWRDVPFVLCP